MTLQKQSKILIYQREIKFDFRKAIKEIQSKVYFQNTQYGYYYLAFEAIMFLQLSTIFYFLWKYEIPSLSWSSQSPYTPTIDRPRAFYTPIFNMNWVNDVPQLWTMFNPLCGRRYFYHLLLLIKIFLC